MEQINIAIPTGTGANLQLPDPFILNYYEALEHRVVWLDSEVSDESIEIVKKIMRWNAEDGDMDIPVDSRVPIKLMISSPGGDVYTMLALMDAILTSKTPVYTCAVSLAASAACVVLLAGHKRFALPHAHAMWHSGSGGLSGTMEQIQSASKHLDTIEDQMQEFFLQRTKIDIKAYKKQKDKDWYFTSAQMLESGLVNQIVESIDEIL